MGGHTRCLGRMKHFANKIFRVKKKKLAYRGCKLTKIKTLRETTCLLILIRTMIPESRVSGHKNTQEKPNARGRIYQSRAATSANAENAAGTTALDSMSLISSETMPKAGAEPALYSLLHSSTTDL